MKCYLTILNKLKWRENDESGGILIKSGEKNDESGEVLLESGEI